MKCLCQVLDTATKTENQSKDSSSTMKDAIVVNRDHFTLAFRKVNPSVSEKVSDLLICSILLPINTFPEMTFVVLSLVNNTYFLFCLNILYKSSCQLVESITSWTVIRSDKSNFLTAAIMSNIQQKTKNVYYKRGSE